MAGTRVTLICTSAACGKAFTRLASQVTKGDPFCSRDCLYAHRSVAIPPCICENPACGRSFTPARANKGRARFCSRECMLAVAQVDMQCPGCGKTHQVRQADTRSERSRLYYCPDCRETAPEQRGRPVTERVEVICANPACGATLLRYPSTVSKTGRMFCDAACRAAGGARVSKKQPRICQYAACGRSFTPGKNATGKFCSRECWNLHKRSVGRVERACAGCGVLFSARKSDPDVYHSWECYQAHRGTPTGARKRQQDGYVLVYAPGHPEAQATGWAFEHRVLISDLLGRALEPDEEVHHVHGVRDDNTVDGPLRLRDGKLRTGTLELWVKSQPPGQRVADQIEWAQKLLARYGDLTIESDAWPSDATSSDCVDCGADTCPWDEAAQQPTGPWEHYNIHNQLWAQAGMGPDQGAGYLCIGCLERRLGRRLEPADFTATLINEWDSWTSPRLANRQGHVAATAT